MPPFPTFNENPPETRKSRFDGNVQILKGQFPIFFHFFLPADFSGQLKSLAWMSAETRKPSRFQEFRGFPVGG
jgi:hypothetical protein